jgi:TRAP-type C4-dicarboxylate transport system substrate-binding protein
MPGTYDSLSADHQKLMDELGLEFTNYMAEQMFRSRTDVKKELQDGIDGHKITVVQPSADMRDAMVKIADADVTRWIEKAGKKGMNADDVLANYKDLIAKYSKERDDKGYPWAR